MDKVTVLDIPFNTVRSSDIPGWIDHFIQNGKQNLIVTPNPEMVLEARRNNKLKTVLQSSSLSLPDGMGILWASKFLSLPSRPKIRIFFQWLKTLISLVFLPKYCKTILIERVTGVDSMEAICQHSELNFYSIFLLGGRENIASATKTVLENKYPRIKIVGTYPGQPFTTDDSTIIEKINTAQPDILFVAFGSPKQEIWIHQHLTKLPSVKIAMGIGGAFDFISGNVKRAPAWMRTCGIEWLFRLFGQPFKRLPRIWNAVVVFPIQTLLSKYSQ